MHRIIAIIIGQCSSPNVLEREVLLHRQQSETGWMFIAVLFILQRSSGGGSLSEVLDGEINVNVLE